MIPQNLGRLISGFIKTYGSQVGVKYRRNGMRHFSGSSLPIVRPDKAPSETMGNSADIHKSHYDHPLHPHAVEDQQELRPLPGPPLPMPAPYGSLSAHRGTIAPPRGARIPAETSRPLLEQFRNFYIEICGTDYGWMNQLGKLLGCGNSRVSVWWRSCKGEHERPNFPNRQYVERMKTLLENKAALAILLDPAPHLREETRRRVRLLREKHAAQSDIPDFMVWAATNLPTLSPQALEDLIADKRSAGPETLIQMDSVIKQVRL